MNKGNPNAGKDFSGKQRSLQSVGSIRRSGKLYDRVTGPISLEEGFSNPAEIKRNRHSTGIHLEMEDFISRILPENRVRTQSGVPF